MSNIRTLLKAAIGERSRARNLDARGASLAGVDLSSLSADALDLRAADLRGTAFCEAHLTACHFEGARFDDADWSSATLRLCALDGARGEGARFDGARLEDSTAEAADLSRASLRNAHLSETSFARAVLRGAVLDNVEGEGVEFRGADLRGATLIGAHLDGADFRGADFRGADLAQGHFHGADFRGALLDGASFAATDCLGAWFDEGEEPHADAIPKTSDVADSRSDAGVSIPGEKLAEETGPSDTTVAAALQTVQDIIRKAVADTRLAGLGGQLESQLGDSTPSDPRLLLEFLRREMDARGANLSEVFKPFEQTLTALQSADAVEPPEEWKPILEPLMKAMNEGRPLDIKVLLDALSKLARPQFPHPDQQ
jgi:uncharacterized protein YjbI with pentapeptide repeats